MIITHGDGLTISQRAKREGSEKAMREIIERIKSNTGWSEDEVNHFLESGAIPATKSNGNSTRTKDLK